MRPFKVAMGLAKLTVLELIALARRFFVNTTGNANIPVPDPTLVVTDDKTNLLENAYNEQQQLKLALESKTDQVRLLRKDLEKSLTLSGLQVDAIAKGDKTIIESTGLPASDQPDPIHLGQVNDLSLTRGDNPGSVDAHWHAITKSNGYTIETSLSAPDQQGAAPWTFYGNSSKSSATITGLTSGSNIWVHVCANGAGQSRGAFSDPAMLIVP